MVQTSPPLLKPRVFTNCLSPSIGLGVQHPEEAMRRARSGSKGAVDYLLADSECHVHRLTMRRTGADVELLRVNTTFSDGVFVQDNAYLIWDEVTQTWIALGASMGPESRREEVSPVLARLAEFGLQPIPFPHHDLVGCIEFGDVFPPMQLGDKRVIFLGRRDYDPQVPCRTDDVGAEWFKGKVQSFGYHVEEFEFNRTLHSTSIGNAVGMTPQERPLILIDGSRCSLSAFHRYGVETPQLEAELRERYAWGLNTVRLNGSVVMQQGFPPVRELLLSYGFTEDNLFETPWTQLPGVDGSISCCCLTQQVSI